MPEERKLVTILFADVIGRVVHAARMRIVLTQRTCDPTHLERARIVFEQLGDRRSLSKLEEVEAALVGR